MDLTQSKTRRKLLLRGLVTFAFGGVLSGLLFTFLVTRPNLQTLWFHTQEFWVIPTLKLWLLTIFMFLVGLAFAYSLGHLKGFVAFPVSRLLLGLLLLAAASLLPVLLTRLTPIMQYFMMRLSLALLLSLSLFMVTRRYYILAAILILVAIMVAPLIASLPDGFIQSFPNEWFEALKFVIASTLLCVLSGYWLMISNSEQYFD